MMFSIHVTVDCGSPTIGSNVVVEGVVPPRVAQGTNVTFECQSGQSYNLTGPAVATCSSSGLWEPDTSAVQCIGQYKGSECFIHNEWCQCYSKLWTSNGQS